MTDPLAQNPRTRIFVIDDDTAMRQSLVQLLDSEDMNVTAFSAAALAIAALASDQPDVILSDVRMPGMSGLARLNADDITVPLVLMSAHGDIATAVQAMQDGAWSFVKKPSDPRRLLGVLRQAASHHRLRRASERMQSDLAALSGVDRVLLGTAPAIVRLRQQVGDIAAAQGPVMVQGATGTGKHLVARALHALGPRRDGPFVVVNCAALGDARHDTPLVGAPDGLRGYWQMAAGGTLFLDEITACPPAAQVQLLQALESGTQSPIGAMQQTGQNAVRVIAATHSDPSGKAGSADIRPDLLFRLTNFVLSLPPLSERGEDVLHLYDNFVATLSDTYEITPPETSPVDAAALMAHDWPGNVRELRHVAERRVLAARRGGGSVAQALLHNEAGDDIPDTLRAAVAAFEKRLIGQAITAHQGRMDAVAEALGIGRRTLNEKIVKLGLDKSALLK